MVTHDEAWFPQEGISEAEANKLNIGWLGSFQWDQRHKVCLWSSGASPWGD